MRTPSIEELATVRRRWEQLLKADPPEAEWQRFFAEHPFALSTGLGLQMFSTDLRPLARPGRAEPDFWFVSHPQSRFPIYGLVELKRSGQRILSGYRKCVPILTRDVSGAVSQLVGYEETRLPNLISLPRASVVLGNEAHLFVVVGLEVQLAADLASLHAARRLPQIPRNLKLVPYDTMLTRYSEFVDRHMPRIHFVYATPQLPPGVVRVIDHSLRDIDPDAWIPVDTAARSTPSALVSRVKLDLRNGPRDEELVLMRGSPCGLSRAYTTYVNDDVGGAMILAHAIPHDATDNLDDDHTVLLAFVDYSDDIFGAYPEMGQQQLHGTCLGWGWVRGRADRPDLMEQPGWGYLPRIRRYRDTLFRWHESLSEDGSDVRQEDVRVATRADFEEVGLRRWFVYSGSDASRRS